MNTSRKGTEYERKFRSELYRRGALWVIRAAASKGPFDLLACFPDVIAAYQLKAHGGCAAAGKELQRILAVTGDWPHYLPYVVHPGKEREFCEH